MSLFSIILKFNYLFVLETISLRDQLNEAEISFSRLPRFTITASPFNITPVNETARRCEEETRFPTLQKNKCRSFIIWFTPYWYLLITKPGELFPLIRSRFLTYPGTAVSLIGPQGLIEIKVAMGGHKIIPI